jgi:hypothetical protein
MTLEKFKRERNAALLRLDLDWARGIIDKLLALGSLVFLASVTISFISIRSRAAAVRLEAMAEWVFLAGLALLSAVTVVIAYAIA